MDPLKIERQVPPIRTVVTLHDYARAIIRAWKLVSVAAGPCTKEAFSVLYAQYMVETGGTACWNWNIGNVKHVTGDGHDFHCLNGVWEGVSQGTAARLIASGEARPDPSLNHARAVGLGRVSVIFNPPHPTTRFRAYADLSVSMAEHLRFLERRYPAAWAKVIAGDPYECAIELGAHGYFTADRTVYGAGMRFHFAKAMGLPAFEDAERELAAAADAATEPDLPRAADPTPLPRLNTEILPPPNAASSPTTYPRAAPEAEAGGGGIIHPLSYGPVDPDDDAA